LQFDLLISSIFVLGDIYDLTSAGL
jgi:hypothetical protein